jgi:hypothetical protein
VHAAVFTPSQAPPQRLPSVAHCARAPIGAPVTGMQVPGFAAWLHAWHCPVQAPLQHTPSAQKPDTHAFPALQAVPFASLGTHWPPAQ